MTQEPHKRSKRPHLENPYVAIDEQTPSKTNTDSHSAGRRVQHLGARGYLRQNGSQTAISPVDYLLVDIAEQLRTPAWISAVYFLERCRQRLTNQGVLVVNPVLTDAAEFTQQLAATRSIFATYTLCLSVPQHRSILVFAFAQHPAVAERGQLDRHTDQLSTQWGLPFDEFLADMTEDRGLYFEYLSIGWGEELNLPAFEQRFLGFGAHIWGVSRHPCALGASRLEVTVLTSG